MNDMRFAWRHRVHVHFVPWLGALYWPYAYTDIFYYAFWPFGYEPAYWAYIYDDFFDGIFFPYGAPYVEYAYGPYVGPYAVETTGAAPSRLPPGRLSRATREFCADQAKGTTAWPFAEIEQAVQPTAEQKELLDNLRKAADEAAARFEQACPEAVPMTPVSRLQAMTQRLQAMLDAVKTVRPPLEEFYNSLSDEQKARFDEIGPQFARQPQQTAGDQPQSTQEACSGEKTGLSGLAAERIEQAVQPTEQQYGALERLGNALQKAVDILNEACPTTTALTPTGRLEAMQKRVEAMIEAGNTVRPALESLYASLSNEQKARFNRLGRNTAQFRR